MYAIDLKWEKLNLPLKSNFKKRATKMNTGKTVFSQLIDYLPIHEFHKCVDRYNGNYKVQPFNCWEKFLTMAFAQHTYCESLRDIETCLRAMQNKLYHMGIKNKISRSTLSETNENSHWVSNHPAFRSFDSVNFFGLRFYAHILMNYPKTSFPR